MADSFEDLGIAPELIAGAKDIGWEAPTPLQQDAVPVLRRGNNGVLHAASGAGVTGAWGLALLDRAASLDDDDAPLALALVSSTDEASRTAATLARIGAPAGVTVRALAPGWPERPARILVATPGAALAAVRGSRLKLDSVLILAIVGADRILALGGWDDVLTLTESATAIGQKVLVTGAFERPIEEYIDARVRKAMNIPPRAADEGPGAEPAGSVVYALSAEEGKVDALVALLDDIASGEVAIVARTAGRAAAIAAGLAGRGIASEGSAGAESGDEPVAEGGAKGEASARRILVLPAPDADRRSTRATVVSADVPWDDATLRELHGAGGVVVATPAELAHLRLIAGRAGLRLQPKALPKPAAADAAESVRSAVRRALQEADLAAYLALVQPLLEEHPAAEVAAAALYLARTGSGAGAAAAGEAQAGSATARRAATGAPAPSTSFVRLFISVGQRDDISAGDIVGAITGESGVAGETVGRIDIRESHSTVEVATADADSVIRALNGRTLKGRSVRVDYDRKDRVAPRGGPPAGGAGKRGPRPGGPRPGGRPGGKSGGSKGGGRPGGRPGGSRSGGRPGGGSGGRQGGSGGRSGGSGGRAGGPRER